MPQRRGAAGADQAARVRGVRHASARRATRWARRWSPARAPARRTTSTAGSTLPPPEAVRRRLSPGRAPPSTSRLDLPAAAARPPTHRDGPRRRRSDVRRAGRAPVPARVRRRRLDAELGDSAVLTCRRRAAGVLHRLVRGAAAVLPRRQHRRPGRQRHGQRPGDERRARRSTCRRRSSSRRASRWTTSARVAEALGAAAARRRRAGSSPATPRSSTRATATGSTSTPRASGWSPPASTSARSGPGPATSSSSAATSGCTASR